MKRFYILFSDIRGHTEWSEKHTPKELVELLKKYYSIPKGNFSHINTSSDEILMFFDNAHDAIDSAQKLKEFGWELEKLHGLSIGVGLHVGEVELLVYRKNKIRYKTYVGHAISIGKRLEGLCDGGEVIISEDVYKDLPEEHKGSFQTKLRVTVKGKKEKLTIYLSNGDLRI